MKIKQTITESKMKTIASSRSGKHQSKASKYIKVATEDMLSKDWISELPSEVLLDILSQLKMKEAGRTSLLSTRWRYLWTCIPNLEFDGSELLEELEQKRKPSRLERPIYVSHVNQVIRHHQGPTIDSFTVVFDLNRSCSCDIDHWLRFAFKKRVQRLKLDLRTAHGGAQCEDCYSFPHSLDMSSCSSLTSIRLIEVKIAGEVLELLLFNCPYLESVYVRRSTTLVTLNVEGPSLKLKWLELRLCHNIELLNISAPNLVSFKYFGPRIGMPLKDVPKIREISIEGKYSCYLTSRLSELQSYVSQLETLTLEACETEKLIKDVRLPVFPKLKHLKVTIQSFHIASLLGYTCLIKASPALYKFSFEIPITYLSDTKKLLKLKAEACPHNIKVVEFKGFLGLALEVEFAMYLMENSVKLEKIVFDTLRPLDVGTWREFTEPTAERLKARECAKQLGRQVPAGTELIIC